MAEDPDEVLGLVNHLVRLVLVRGGEEVDSEVAHEVDSDRSRLRDRQRSAPPSTPRELALDVSARADASTCVPTSARRAVALLCALFTTFKRKRAREPPAGYTAGWHMFEVTAKELVHHMRFEEAGLELSCAFGVTWDGWYESGRLTRSLAHMALLPFRALLKDHEARWVALGLAAEGRGRRKQVRVQKRNHVYVLAVRFLVNDGDPEDIASEDGDPLSAVLAEAVRIAAELDFGDFFELERCTSASDRRRHIRAALADAGYGGSPKEIGPLGICLYVPEKLNSQDLLRRAAHALSLTTFARGCSGGPLPDREWQTWWDCTVVAKAEEIATALVTDERRRKTILDGAAERGTKNSARSRVRLELECATSRHHFLKRMDERAVAEEATEF